MTDGGVVVVANLFGAICAGIEKGWPDEAETFSGIVLFCLNEWIKKDLPEKITFRHSELADYLNLSDAEGAKDAFECFGNKIDFTIKHASHYIFEIIGDPACPDEIKEVSIKDRPELFAGSDNYVDYKLFTSQEMSWNDKSKDGKVTLTINSNDELCERIRDEDLSSFQIKLTTPYLYDGKDIMEWWKTGKTAYQKNADEPHKEITVKFNM